MNYEVVIGLETHIEQNTKTKMFCSCKNEFGAQPNTNVCEVCTAMPGALPKVNQQAVYNTIKAGLATNCTINKDFAFDRKNYFYPDNPKAYQISQLYVPICTNGRVDLTTPSGKNFSIRIHQIHLEEDAGKLIHNDFTGETMVDFNRCGVPLMEIVTEPDFRSTEEVMTYLEYIRSTFKAIGVTDCKMERGQLRCDVNISLRPQGQKTYGERTEMKNINSLKAIERAITYEVQRQTNLLNEGKHIAQETLRWDDLKGKNFTMRSKEDAEDYRYFPEPDLYPFHVSAQEVEKLKRELPLLPNQRIQKYKNDYGFSDYDAQQLAKETYIYTFFDKCVECGISAKESSNWIQGEIAKIINEEMAEQPAIKVSPLQLKSILQMLGSGAIAQATARDVLRKVWGNNIDPQQLVKDLGLAAVSDDSAIRKILEQIIQNNPQAVADYKGGNKKAVAFFVGQTMKATQGKANAQVVNKLIAEMLN